MSLTPIALEIDQGDDEIIDIQLEPATPGDDVDLTNCKLMFYIKVSPADADIDALIRKSSDVVNEITITNVVNGVANVQIAHVDTSSFTASQCGYKLPWSLQVIDAVDKITTLARGTIVVNRDLIQAVS